MNVLVTGGAGFIGSHIVDRLIKEGFTTIVVDNLSTGKEENLNPFAKFYRIDIQSSSLSDIFNKEKPDIVFHLAAQIDVRRSVEDPLWDARINILGSLNLIELCKNHRVKKVIFASTGGAIYGEAEVIPTPETYPEAPLSPYGIAKLCVERYLWYYYKIFNLPFISLRLANVYGPRQNSKGEAGVIAIFCDKMLAGGQPVINGDGSQTRDFVFVEDVVEAAMLAMNSEEIGIFNIGTAIETDIITIFEKLKKLTGSHCKRLHGPAKEGEQRRSCLDYTKAKEKLGWNPRMNIDQGLEKTVESFRGSLTR